MTIAIQKNRSLFVNHSGEPRPWLLVILYPVGASLIVLTAAFIIAIAPLLIFVGIIGAACSWLDKVGRT